MNKIHGNPIENQPLPYQPKVKSNNAEKIDKIVLKLQKLWAVYYNSPSKGLKNNIRHLIAKLNIEMEKAKIVANSLTSNQQKKIVQHYHYSLACLHQLGDTDPKRRIQASGLKVQNVEKDGNCCLRAIAKQISSENENKVIKKLRVRLVKEMRSKLMYEIDNNVKNGLVASLNIDTSLNKGIQQREVNKYCNKLAENGEWLGEHEVEILSQILNRPIWIYSKDSLINNEQGKLEVLDAYKHNENAKGEPIRLYFETNHYQAIIK